MEEFALKKLEEGPFPLAKEEEEEEEEESFLSRLEEAEDEPV